jgi:anion-transporting  ArsA/GET3 family ATPase
LNPKSKRHVVARTVAPVGIAELLRTKRVLISVGAGGVGKTTTTAALGVAAARSGKRVLCLTIDPAKRLAESLGISEMRAEAVMVPKERFEAAGIAMSGSLTCMMLDTKQTFDELVRKHASTPERAENLLKNRLYQYVSTSLAGTKEYMAMEKLSQVRADDAYDLVLLDTPPTANALDFLDAPGRLVEALDSSTMKFFVDAFESSGKFSFNLLAKGAQIVLRNMGKITGSGFLEAMSEFIVELNDLFGGFRARAKAVEATLRSDDVAFVLVTSPSSSAVREVLFFSERLAEAGMPRGAFVINRIRKPAVEPEPTPAALAKALDGDTELAARVFAARRENEALSALDESSVAPLLMGAAAAGATVVRIYELPSNAHDLPLLAQLGERLTGG